MSILSLMMIMVNLNLICTLVLINCIWIAEHMWVLWSGKVPGSATMQHAFFGAKDTIFLVIGSLTVIHTNPSEV